MIGQTISHYKITAKLGEGGMGVVYKAEDTKLERTVALKFIAGNLIKDAEARKRFEREAKAAAGVSHANVCHVYEIAEVEERTFLAMEFVDGEGLDKRIERGPFPLKDALDFARQTAEGLAAAHAKGVVHRDIKPGNLLVTPTGQVKILDFGLALLTEGSKLTQLDTKVGTVAYMSPEQAQGMEVDHRTDVWALGCVIYEMVSGRRPFLGHYDQALVYSIVNEPPDPLTGLRTGVPMELEFIVGKCLEKEAASRYQQVSEVAVDLRNLQDKLKSGRSTIVRASQMTRAVPASTAQTLNPAAILPPDAVVMPRSRQRLLYALLAVVTLALLAVTAVSFTEAPRPAAEQLVRRFSFPQPGLTAASISPDGRYIAFVADTNSESIVWLRAISSETAREIPGTEGARPAIAWSPDGQSIVFATTSQVKRVAIDGGEALTLCDLVTASRGGFRGGTWSPDGERIVFSSGNSLYEIPARGGQPKVLVDREPDELASSPHFLPMGGGPQALVYLSQSRADAGTQIMALNLETGERSEIGPGGEAVYSQQGYLILSAANRGEDGLFALPFSLASLRATGESFRIAEHGFGASIAGDGTLIYLEGVRASAGRTLVWRDRSGAVLQTVGQPQRRIQHPSLSPDGQRVAVTAAEAEATSADIWVQDLARSTKTRLTFDPATDQIPAWSPSGDQIVYWHEDANGSSLMRKSADGTGEAVALAKAKERLLNVDWSRDGRYVVYQQGNTAAASSELRYLEIRADGMAGEPVTFLATPASEGAPKFSPDGRFVAYVSDESGRPEVYMKPFPEGAGRWHVSVEGGGQPRWSRNGKELFFVRDDTLLSVPVSTGQGVTLGQQRELFRSDDLRVNLSAATYDVSADGQRFLTVAPVEQGAEAAPPKVRVVQNWYEEFRGRERN